MGFKPSRIFERSLLVKDTEFRTSVLEWAVVHLFLPEVLSTLTIGRRGQTSFQVWKILGFTVSRAQHSWALSACLHVGAKCVLEGWLRFLLLP